MMTSYGLSMVSKQRSVTGERFDSSRSFSSEFKDRLLIRSRECPPTRSRDLISPVSRTQSSRGRSRLCARWTLLPDACFLFDLPLDSDCLLSCAEAEFLARNGFGPDLAVSVPFCRSNTFLMAATLSMGSESISQLATLSTGSVTKFS